MGHPIVVHEHERMLPFLFRTADIKCPKKYWFGRFVIKYIFECEFLFFKIFKHKKYIKSKKGYFIAVRHNRFHQSPAEEFIFKPEKYYFLAYT